MKYKYPVYIIFLLSLVFAVTSCKTARKVVRIDTNVEAKENHAIFSDVLNNNLKYRTLSSKLNFSVSTGNKTLNTKASLKIIKDKALLLSIQPLFGVELFRLHIDADTLILLDRMNKRYIKEAIVDLKKYYPIGFDFSSLQSLFTNNLFVSGKSYVQQDDFNSFSYNIQSDKYYVMKATDKLSDIDYTFSVNGSDKIAMTYLESRDDDCSLKWRYDDFVQESKQLFPHKMNIVAKNSFANLDLDINFKEVEFNSPGVTISTKIPNDYSRTSISRIISILKSLQ